MDHSQRQQALNLEILVWIARGFEVETLTYPEATFSKKSKVNHVLHAILSLLSGGLWLLVWAFLILFTSKTFYKIAVREDGVIDYIEYKSPIAGTFGASNK